LCNHFDLSLFVSCCKECSTCSQAAAVATKTRFPITHCFRRTRRPRPRPYLFHLRSMHHHLLPTSQHAILHRKDPINRFSHLHVTTLSRSLLHLQQRRGCLLTRVLHLHTVSINDRTAMILYFVLCS